MTILDTNVVSEIMRPLPSRAVLRWMSTQPPDRLHVTSITIAEVMYGIELLPSGKRQEALRMGAEKLFQVVFADRILGFDARAAREFSMIASSRRRRGRPISELDAQIAAITRFHGGALATRDIGDFEGCGIELINPWRE